MNESIGILIIGIILFFCVAEFFGRSKHIGKWWAFFLLIGGIIPGIIALLVSPSAKSSPTKANSSYKIWAVICIILGILNLIGIGVSRGQYGHFFFIFIILGFYLFNLSEGLVFNKDPKYYFAINQKQSSDAGKKSIPKNKSEKPKISIDKQKQSIQILKDKGLLTDSEFQEKMDMMDEQIKIEKVHKSAEYLNLKSLYENGVFTKEEFENKIELLKTKKIVDSNPNQYDIVREKVIGTWKDNLGTVKFRDDNSFVFNDKNKDITNGTWRIPNINTVEIRFNSKVEKFTILELDEEVFSYRHNNSRFTLTKQ